MHRPIPLRGASLLVAISLLAVCHSAFSADYQAIVSKQARQDGFRTINEALKAAPADDSPYVIYVEKGVYEERLNITRPNITLLGEQRDGTIISAGVYAGMLDEQGQKIGTSGSRTVLVNAPDFTARNLTIRNSFDYPANAEKLDTDPTKVKDTQAVALLLDSKSDRARFHQVRLEGYQDTFYTKAGSRSYFTDCEVSGHVDFIFGSGVSVFDHCDIIARRRTDIAPPHGYLTAPSTDINSPYGLVFLHSRLLKEMGVPARSFALGRPWHPTTTFDDGRYADPNAIGQSVFIKSYIDDHIYGWDKMSGKDKDGNTIWFYPQDSRFYEGRNYGPGAALWDVQRRQLSADQLRDFTVAAIFPDWKPHKYPRSVNGKGQ
ncbi:pectinesterase [Pseudomonas duriflava]|uniref:Pectinesterase n=1 Tax=Pseudomonas duriflava TaxID=459528 RepID=A0A562QA91_9PSED|nr:pectinesterase family protein [Pseudomonas duriflava]TWI53681.1 pectinesterase [Pseudomonas duriflava]